MQSYLVSGNSLNVHSIRQIFQMRVRNSPIKCNFSNLYKDKKCVAPGCSEDETQSHIYLCNFLNTEAIKKLMPNDLKYDDLFSNDICKQFQVTAILNEKLKVRQRYIS